MTKANIAQNRIASEYMDAGVFDVVTYDAATGQRLGTCGGLDLHKAFAEMLVRMQNGATCLVLQFPADMPKIDRWDAEQRIETARPHIANLQLGR